MGVPGIAAGESEQKMQELPPVPLAAGLDNCRGVKSSRRHALDRV